MKTKSIFAWDVQWMWIQTTSQWIACKTCILRLFSFHACVCVESRWKRFEPIYFIFFFSLSSLSLSFLFLHIPKIWIAHSELWNDRKRTHRQAAVQEKKYFFKCECKIPRIPAYFREENEWKYSKFFISVFILHAHAYKQICECMQILCCLKMIKCYKIIFNKKIFVLSFFFAFTLAYLSLL